MIALDDRGEVAILPVPGRIDLGTPEAVGDGGGDAVQLGFHLLQAGACAARCSRMSCAVISAAAPWARRAAG